MKKRLAALSLLLVLFGSAFAGVPMEFGGTECSMHEMMEGMDCCKAARLQVQTPEVAEAKLCCALICAQNGTSSPPNGVRVTPPATPRLLNYPATPNPLLNASFFRRTDPVHGPQGSPPVYLRNLALLI